VPRSRRRARSPVGLALAGGGPFGAIYEIGALMALEDSLEGVDLNELHCYVGVSAGSFLAAALANGNRVDAIYRMFIEEGQGQGALTPGIFMRPAFREYGRRARLLPGLLARSAWRYFTRPFSAGSLEAFAALGRAIPTGLFDNEAIHEYLEEVFTQPGQTNDFRRLRRRLFLVATDLDSGGVVSFGRPGRDDVPISKAVQASSALPGLFPPVEIGGHHFVDGALKKTLHASEALDAGARLVICINPIVPFDARLEASRRGTARSRLVEGGLPVVLSQTFRAVIHSRMAVGMSKYESQYRGADVVLFQPDPDDSTIFFTNIFSYATRRQVCEHAYQRTRADLLQRRGELQPILARHGIRMRLDRLAEPQRRLEARVRARPGMRLTAVAANLRDTLRELRRAV
jgi:NTE family protein